MNATRIFKELLSPLWLRPESAMWYAHMLTLAEASIGKLQGPSMDFGCMDGVNSFILLGGKFNNSFDVYSEVNWSHNAHLQSTLKNDYFDAFNEHFSVNIDEMPEVQFDLGIDWKESHLNKCRRLGIYKKLQKIDVDNPVFDAPDNYFETIWAPNIYWMRNLPEVISELSRVLSKTGKLITIGPDKRQLDFMFFKYADAADRNWLQNLDRGRYENAQASAKTYEGWKELFNEYGLEIAIHKDFIPELVAKAYDIGLRPMFPVFMNIYETLKENAPEDLVQWKEHWVQTITDFVSPFCETAWLENNDTRFAWHFFELKKV